MNILLMMMGVKLMLRLMGLGVDFRMFGIRLCSRIFSFSVSIIIMMIGWLIMWCSSMCLISRLKLNMIVVVMGIVV